NAPTSYLSSERANHRHLDSFPTRRSSDLPKPGERYAAALGGHTEVLYEQAGDVLQYLKAGQLRPLIIFAEKRHPAFADVPTSKELGFDITLPQFRGLATRKGVPVERVKALADAFARAMQTSQWKKFAE